MRVTMRDIRKYHGCNSIHVVKAFAKLHGLDMSQLLLEGWDVDEIKKIDDVIARNIITALEADK